MLGGKNANAQREILEAEAHQLNDEGQNINERFVRILGDKKVISVQEILRSGKRYHGPNESDSGSTWLPELLLAGGV